MWNEIDRLLATTAVAWGFAAVRGRRMAAQAQACPRPQWQRADRCVLSGRAGRALRPGVQPRVK
jgi:hypothetical protein